MSENIKVQTIDEYIMTCVVSVQSKLTQLRNIIKEASPDLIEKISWGMPTFQYKGNVIHFASHKKHIGLYCGKDAVEEFKDRLETYKTHNGTIQIPNERDLDISLIQDIVKYNIKVNISK